VYRDQVRAWIAATLVAAMVAPARADQFDPFASMHGQPPKPKRDYAPRALDPALSRRIAAMLDLRGAGDGAALGDHGDREVFTWNVTGTNQVWRQDGPMKYPVQLTGGEDPTRLVAMSPDERWLVVSRDAGLYVMDPAGGPLRLVNAHAELAYITDDSKGLYFVTADGVSRWDVVDGKTTVVIEAPWRIVDHRGDRWLVAANDEVSEYDLPTKVRTPVPGQTTTAAYGAKPGQILVQIGASLYAVEGGRHTQIATDVSSFAIDSVRARIYVTVSVGATRHLSVLDARTLKRVELPALPESDTQTVSGISRNGRYVELALEGARLPATTVTVDWTTRKLTTWRAPATPEIDVKSFAPVTAETYPARDGAKVPMFVRRPASCDEPCPVVVSLPAGPVTPGFSPIAQLYVEAGFVFIEPDPRGDADIADLAAYLRSAWAKTDRAPKLGVVGGAATLAVMASFDAGVAAYPKYGDLANVKAPLLAITDEEPAGDVPGALIVLAEKRANLVLQVGHSIAFLQQHLETR
jgi:dipeptidyl aminopeptidase/acylaminoacyl peptidase